ncbi:hypothetical protein AAGU66_06110 [Edwardsiella ictaluri]|uniref:hypothetical protein n=1 Tax=Edwardsiella ictaluri TaxID=67780 RepID=UPI0018DB7B8C|nr:hypothetical protein [Edwardsiella ictaluri]QPW29734.1 hypothetical protein F8539_06745 [Edwardsiella ictaluri]UYB62856.1 hypothetical protein N8I66_06725 [Edwardsiella ictaluri]UYB66082.1 hypothetical protein N8I67_06720 [Edwardsiella ictaluri]WJH20767.1 hypothetical protein FGU63_06755 [Edwardsiella ictaluri]BEH98550.1 hypothetical protein KH20906_12780 [Edwardsiella ictaluri]
MVHSLWCHAKNSARHNKNADAQISPRATPQLSVYTIAQTIPAKNQNARLFNAMISLCLGVGAINKQAYTQLRWLYHARYLCVMFNGIKESALSDYNQSVASMLCLPPRRLPQRR